MTYICIMLLLNLLIVQSAFFSYCNDSALIQNPNKQIQGMIWLETSAVFLLVHVPGRNDFAGLEVTDQ